MQNGTSTYGKRLRVCLIAYSCTPGHGSEEGVGWGWTKGMSRYVDIVLLTRKNNVSLIRRQLKAFGIHSVNVQGLDWPEWCLFWKRGKKGAMAYHYLWQMLAAFVAKKLHRQHRFDVFHHLNFSVSWQPCWVAFVGKSVFGPLDSGRHIPFAFWSLLGMRSTLMEVFRAAVVWWGEHLDPFVRLSQKFSKAVVFRSRFPSVLFYKRHFPLQFVIPDTGLDESEAEQLLQLSLEKKKNNTVRIIFMGRLIARKGLTLAIQSFSSIAPRYNAVELVVIGDGPERKKMEAFGGQWVQQGRIRFVGKVERFEAWKMLADGDIFLYPSLRDAVATVVIEAMAAGLPVICLDGTGPAQVINSDLGVTVQIKSEKETTENITNALIELIENESLRKKIGQHAQTVVALEHTWDARARAMLKVYSAIRQGM